MFPARFPRSQPATYCGSQASRTSSHGRRLSSERHDLRQLSEIARVFLEGGDEGEARDRYDGGCWKFPFVMIVLLRHCTCALSFLCYIINCVN